MAHTLAQRLGADRQEPRKNGDAGQGLWSVAGEVPLDLGWGSLGQLEERLVSGGGRRLGAGNHL